MKKFLSTLSFCLVCLSLFAQAPQKFTYQAVVRDVVGKIVTNSPIGVRVSIMKNSDEGITVYSETHQQSTNANGLLSLEIGGGNVLGGEFSAIDWANGPYFLKIETDIAGGNNYTIVSLQQLLSVPYALYAQQSGNAFSGNYDDLSNKPEIPTKVSAFENDAKYITKDSIPTQVSAFNNDAGYITELQLLNWLEELQGQIDSLKQAEDEDDGNEMIDELHGKPCPNLETVTDIDGNMYSTIQIGTQCWMAENLRTTKYADSTSISQGRDASTTIGYWYYPNDDATNKEIFGLLYNWPAVMKGEASSNGNPSGVQGICPMGWHVPSDAEWKQLEDYVIAQSEYRCGTKSFFIAKALASTTEWESSTYTCDVGCNPSSNNATGFSAFPAGDYYLGGYNDFNISATFWCATLLNSRSAYIRDISFGDAGVGRNGGQRDFGFSVRCVYDEKVGNDSTALASTVSTFPVTNLTATTASCGGNVTDDGGATVTARGVCWSTSQNPTIADSHTTDGKGTGSYYSSLTGLTAATTYYVRAYATSKVGTSYGEQMSFTTTSVSFTCGTSTITDYDNNTYNTVQIGAQCWMKENLKTTHYSDGTAISQGSTTSSSVAYWYYPDANSTNKASCGLLYNWLAVMKGASSSNATPSGVQGICPMGWHVPSDPEWTQLENYVGSQSAYQCGNVSSNIAKALASTKDWYNSSITCSVGNMPSSNNTTGFSAVPAGSYSDSYSFFGYFALFWSTVQDNSDYAFSRSLFCGMSSVVRSLESKDNGFSVRCLRD